MTLFMSARISVVRNGFSYERVSLTAQDWPDLSRQIEIAARILSDENPDRIVITLERPQ
jgi:hypothetical protein